MRLRRRLAENLDKSALSKHILELIMLPNRITNIENLTTKNDSINVLHEEYIIYLY